MQIAERLKWARETAGISQRRLAKLAELGDATIRHIEGNDPESIDVTTARKIGAVLGCSPAWLLTGEGDAPTEASLVALGESVIASGAA